MSDSLSVISLTKAFAASGSTKPRLAKRPPPVSIRFNDKERSILAERSRGEPLGPYIKRCMLDGHSIKKKTRGRTPVKDHQALARVLSALGRSDLSTVLGGILLAVEAGKLNLDPDSEQALHQASHHIDTMRSDLIIALGLQSGGWS